MKYTKAIVRPPGDNYNKCISEHPLKHNLNIKKAREQHDSYCGILEELGLEIIKLPYDHNHPDSCFVEDTVIIHNNKAFITRMAKKSRREEYEAVESVLEKYFSISKATEPATIEGGDVIHLENSLISGITQRTNYEGVKQAAEWLDTRIGTIEGHNMIHLKSHLTYLGQNTMLVTKMYASLDILNKFDIVVVAEGEEYAANSLTINETTLIPNFAVETQKRLKDAGFDIIPTQMTEFEKCEGALTCLSLLF